ncbi:MAG: hypothetical protein JW730_22480 [Anaerolineales bacterium]|nr:hypothetical protein [Anaerolineales bacterium]
MQPDPLSPPQEEKQPEPVSPRQETPPPVQPPPAPAPVQAAPRPAPTPVQAKKGPRWGIAAILLALVVVVLFVAAAGLGFWAYSLNTKLAAAEQQLAALQGDYDKLKADNATLTSDKDKLNADLTQTKADLEKANADLAAAQGDLKTAQDQNSDLNARMNKANKLAEILYTWFTTNDAAGIFKLDSQIKATDDAKLKSLWDRFMTAAAQKRSTNNEVGELLIHIATSLRDNLK